MIKLETSLWYISIFLRGLSFWPLSSEASVVTKTISLAHFMLIFFAATLMFFQILVYVYQNSISSQFIAEHVSTQLAFLQLTIKVVMYRIHKEKLCKLLMDVNHMIKNGSPCLRKHLEGYASTCNLVYFTYTTTIFVLATDYCLVPFFKADKDLPITAWYPFDYKQSTLHYSIAYLHQLCVIVMSWLCSGVDVTFGLLVFCCCARYKVMQDILKSLKQSDMESMKYEENHGKNESNDEHDEPIVAYSKKIKKLVDLHCQVFNSIRDINDIHTWILLVLFLTSVIMICCAGLQITNVAEQSLNSKFVFSCLVCCVLLELLFYFVPGDILVTEANALGLAAYCSSWESMPPNHRNSILSIMLRCAAPPKLQGARVKTLILQNYGSFLATTASYFTSLQAIAGVDGSK
ncbi:odorant receptor 83a-like isoform X1 [Neodiprion fabricii]|uniref:odorant receptor 83a-like isoform X1 n=1 Tax=Neodiprion fabricii TaxID=2872261 RepID=UPI001ED8F19F|nr:odorant receptor 83a-like isoform X1 [Neodiprion fabricii]